MKKIQLFEQFKSSNRAIGRVVFTGGPGTGKTSVLQELQSKGHPVVAEAFRIIIQQLSYVDDGSNSLKDNPLVKKWLDSIPDNDRDILQLLSEKQNVLNYKNNPNALFDRGLVDEVGYRYYYNLPIKSQLEKDCDLLRYDKVFFFPIWEKSMSMMLKDLKHSKKLPK